MPGMADAQSLGVMGQGDMQSSIVDIPGPNGPMQVDISKMLPEDAELLEAVMQDASIAEDPEVQAELEELLNRLAVDTPQFEELGQPPMDTRGGPNMTTPVGNVSQMDIGEAQSRKARARHQPYTGQESALYPGMKY
jgi:hypothetical protein